MKNNRILVHVIAALALALAILTMSFLVTIRMTKSRMEKIVDHEAERKSLYINNLTNLAFLSSEWIINSFMAGVLDLQSYEDSLTHELRFKTVLDDNYSQSLTLNDIYQPLEDFCLYNYDVNAVVLIFEPDVLAHYPQGIAVKMIPNDTTRHDLLAEGYHVFESKLYQSVKVSNGVMVQAGIVGKDDRYVFTTGIAIQNEQGRVIGEFWVDTDAKAYSKTLQRYKSDDNIILSFVDTDGRVAASCYPENNGKYIKDVIVDYCLEYQSEQWYEDVHTACLRDSFSVFRNKIADEAYVTYILPITNSPYSLLIVKSEKTLYRGVARFIAQDSAIMLVTLLLVGCCLLYLFRVFKRKNDETARMENELNMAASIQQGILPPNTHLSDKVDIYGYQRSAKMVGGDLYDFAIQGEWLHFCIGDVSGKGMPAALVMTELSSLYRYIIRYHCDPSEIVTLMNKALMERSDDTMFCTLFVGVMNLTTGLLQYCNAGHNPPIVIRADKAEFLKVKPNMPVYAFEDYVYQSESLQLNAGDRLFLYTDGVTEAKNKDDRFYGEKATLQTISGLKALPLDRMISGMMAALHAFTQKAVQHDDITMLCVEYKGGDNGTTFHYDHVKEHVTDIVNAIVDACGLQEDMRFRLAIEEPVQNIADYAYDNDGSLDVEITQETDCVVIVIKDNGHPFNPLLKEEPDLSMSVEQRPIGGLGIFLTRKIMTDVAYNYENQQNILTLKYTKI